VFIPGMPFQASRMFVGKDRSLPKSRALEWALPSVPTLDYAEKALQERTL